MKAQRALAVSTFADGQFNLEAGLPKDRGFQPDPSPRSLHDGSRNRQAKAAIFTLPYALCTGYASLRPCGVARVEDLLQRSASIPGPLSSTFKVNSTVGLSRSVRGSPQGRCGFVPPGAWLPAAFFTRFTSTRVRSSPVRRTGCAPPSVRTVDRNCHARHGGQQVAVGLDLPRQVPDRIAGMGFGRRIHRPRQPGLLRTGWRRLDRTPHPRSVQQRQLFHQSAAGRSHQFQLTAVVQRSRR